MPDRLISQLAHLELLTPDPEASLAFFRDIVGLEESGRDAGSVYLRCWGDHFRYSLQLTEASQLGLGHAAWRTQGPEQLERAVVGLEAAGVGDGWRDDQLGHGPAYRFRGPGGHLHELVWEVERFDAPPELRSEFPARSQRHTGRGITPRHLDHVTVVTADPYGDAEWYRDSLGYRFMEYTLLNDESDVVVFTMVTTNEKSHDLGLVVDFSGVPGRIHHFAFWVDAVEDVLRAADLLMENGVQIEFGPGRHGMGEQTYLYFREPGGLRVEINSGGYRNYVPDWQPVKWVPSQGSNTMYRNLHMPDVDARGLPTGRDTRSRAGARESLGPGTGALMAAVGNVLVVGGGPAGLSAAAVLGKRGIDVDLVEINEELRPLGSGLTMMGPSLRALRAVDPRALEECVRQGAGHDALGFGDGHGDVHQRVELPRPAGPEYPGGFGIMRPVFWGLLADAAKRAGAKIRLSTTVEAVEQRNGVVEVGFNDGSTGSYDLVVGADGLHSRTRELAFPDAPKPFFTGQTVWRAVVPRARDRRSDHVLRP